MNDKWIAYAKQNSHARIRLFCLPYAGGGAAIYKNWHEQLPPTLDIYPIQLPGRETRIGEAPFTHLPSLVEELALALKPYLDLPFAFFGHSMGALISFELASFLYKNMRLQSAYLFASGRHAPHIKKDTYLRHTLSDKAFREELRNLSGTPEEVLQNEEIMQIMLPVLRADFSICENYNYTGQEPLHCPITVFGGKSDTEASYEDLTAWYTQTTKPFTLRILEGDHFFLHHERRPMLQSIASDLKPILSPRM